MNSVLLYTVHKAASSFLDQLLRQTCRRFGIAHYSENNDQFHDEIHSQSWANFIHSSRPETACFGPIRGTPRQPLIPVDLDNYSVILHLRDPRDVLTSLYFSFAFSHKVIAGRFEPEPGQREMWQEKGIDQFVLHYAKGYRANYEVLLDNLLGRENVTLVHYEDLVTNYPRWLAQYLSGFKHLEVPPRKKRDLLLPQSLRRHKIHYQLAKKHRDAFEVDKEDPRSHKRRIIPGDHLNKLTPETCEQLDEQFASILRVLRDNRLDQRQAA